MKAVAIKEFGGREQLRLIELPKPSPGPEEVLVRVKAAGVNPMDWKIREGRLKDRLPCEFPLVLGWDAAGVVEKTGEKTKRLKVGDEVFAYCRKPVIKDGAYAEYIVLPEEMAALKPVSASFAEAAAIPLAALTAYQALFDAGSLTAGETALIHAAAGGVGSFAVQMAKHRGARTLGTAGRAKHEYLKKIGLDFPIDYKADDFREKIRQVCPEGVDFVLNSVDKETLWISACVLKNGGRIVSLTDPDEVDLLVRKGIDAQYLFVKPDRRELEEIAEMVDSGVLKPFISASLSLDEAIRAHEMSESRHIQGKIVLTL